MKCFYHKSDLDGHCSGAIIKQKYPQCEMIGVDYKDEIDMTTIERNEKVFIVDFSFSRSSMRNLVLRADLVWIDHHKSAIEKCKGLTIKGFRVIGTAGCELTWRYIHPCRSTPTAVRLLGRYDVWDHVDLEVLPFQYGMRTHESTLPESICWEGLLPQYDGEEYSYVAIIETGEIILAYEKKQNAMFAKGMAFESDFHGYRAICINRAYSNSKIFDSVYDPEKHDIMILFGVKADEWKYSLYCDKPGIDVSELAVKYGGGGHASAAGFYANQMVL